MRLLLCIAFLSLLSCSGDDIGPGSHELYEISYFSYDYNGDRSIYLVDKFESNQLKESYHYHIGEVEGRTVYFYNTDNALVSYTYTPTNYAASKSVESITYDNLKRISSIEKKSGYTTVIINFDYSQQAHIIANYIRQEYGEVKNTSQNIYDLDETGRVNKITKKDSNGDVYSIMEAIYEGNNITTIFGTNYIDGAPQNNTSYIVYNKQIPVKGEYLNIDHNRFGPNKANHVIYSGFYTWAKDNYYESINGAGKEYVFDSEGYPVKFINYTHSGAILTEYLISYK